MKKYLIIFVLCLVSGLASAANGYKLTVKFTEAPSDTTVFLARYFAKPFPSMFKVDSINIPKGTKEVVFQTKENILGGIFIVLFNRRTQMFDVVLDNGFDVTIISDTTANKSTMQCTGSLDNEININAGKIAEKYYPKLADPKVSEKEKDKIREKMADETTQFRLKVIKEHPNLLIGKIFAALQPPTPPDGKHYLADGKTIDSFYEFNFIKNNYWTGFDLKDDRLIGAPILEKKLEDYFNNWVIGYPDSVIYAADELLAKMKGAEELYKYTLRWLSNYSLNSKVLGMDEVFLHIAEEYYLKGEAYWADEETLKWYKEQTQKMSPTSLFSTAPDLVLQDLWTNKDIPLSSINAKYTLVIFWDPECGSCQKETKSLDSLYRIQLKDLGIHIYSVIIDGEIENIRDYIKTHNFDYWTNVGDLKQKNEFRTKYDVFGTPRLFLLDENKKIIGKKISHADIPSVIKWYENIKRKQNKQ